MLTAERVRLLRRAKAGSLPIAALASGSSGISGPSAAMWFDWKKQACFAQGIGLIQDTADKSWLNRSQGNTT